MCAEAQAARARLEAAQQLTVAAHGQSYGYAAGMRAVFRPVPISGDWERLLGRFDQVEEEKKQ